jgi:inhibitor of the pro-sigma K processing machinery
MEYLYIIIIGLVVLAIAKFLLNLKIRKLFTLVLNIVLGIVVLWLVNTFGSSIGIYVPINIITILVVGLGGLPGVILLIVFSITGVI